MHSYRHAMLGTTATLFASAVLVAVAHGQEAPKAPPAVTPPASVKRPEPPSELPGRLAIDVGKVPQFFVQTSSPTTAGIPWAAVGPPLISAVVTLLGTFVALFYGYRNTKKSIAASEKTAAATIAASERTLSATVWQKTNETELKDLQAKLDGFFVKFQQLTEVNSLISRELRSRQSNTETFFLMDRLFDSVWRNALPVGDAALLGEIIENTTRLERLILDNTSTVEAKIVPYLARAAAHFRILRLAYENKLGSDATNFKKYLYPRQINKVLALELDRIQQRQELLRAAPSERPAPMPELIIPDTPDYALPAWANPPIAPVKT